MRWSRRHPYTAWLGTILLLALLFIGVRDVGVSSASRLAIAITIACAVALIAGDLIAVLVHHRRHHRPS